MKKINTLIEKGTKYIGVITLSVIVFFVAAYVIVEACDYVYYNTSMLDAVYWESWFSYAQCGITAIVASKSYDALKKKCFSK